jgi:hypothetical protein
LQTNCNGANDVGAAETPCPGLFMNIDLRVLELACSKLCHDVISPIGAVNNGLELLEEEEDTSPDILLLVKETRWPAPCRSIGRR